MNTWLTPLARWARGLGLAALVVLLALTLTGVALWQALRSERGSAWLLNQLPGVVCSGTQGALLGDFEAAQILIQLPSGGGSIALSQVGWHGLHIERSHDAGLWLRIRLAELHAQRIELRLASSQGSALTPPTDLRLPLELDVVSLNIGEISWGAQPLRDLRLRIHLSAESGGVHRIDVLNLAWGRLHGQGSAQVATRAPLRVEAKIAIAQNATANNGLNWNAQATLAGPLQQPQLHATIRATSGPTQREQSLDTQATLRPFEAWPLAELQARTQSLDLSFFHEGAPVTSLSGEASMRTTARDQPATLSLRLANAQAGRWNEGHLPLRQLTLELHGRPDQPQTLQLQTFSAELGTQLQVGGQMQGHGQWTPQRWTLDANLTRLQPSLLDARAAAVPLSGPISLVGSDANIDAKVDLSGQLSATAAPRTVQLKFDASVSAQRIELRNAQVSSGDSRASLSALATRANAAWQLKGQGALERFDPLGWWQGREDSPWRRGPHQLNAKAEFDLSLPTTASTVSVLDTWPAARGHANLEFTRSLLAGVPFNATATWRHTDARSAAVALKIDAAGNTLAANTAGPIDRWDFNLAAPALNRLTPLWQLAQPAQKGATLAGAVTASGHVSGHWPTLATQGEIDATGLNVNASTVQRAHAHWQIDTAAGKAIDLQATLSELVLSPSAFKGSPPIESAQLQLNGTTRNHHLMLRAETRARPPAWTDTFRATSATATHTLAQLQVQGSLTDAANSFTGWHGTLQQIELSDKSSNATPWLRASDLGIELQWAGGPPRANVQPGRAEVLGGLLRWSHLRWQAAQERQPAQIEAHAELEPLTLAPLLARLQPDFGWGGDLAVGGRIDLHSAPSFGADIVLERHHGDLSVTDELGTQTLGLTDLRVALNAHDGVWSFTQALAGNALGVAAGAVVARTSPQATWPAADTPIQGTLEIRVANLGTWGRWVPPGWRLNGALRTSASVGGRITAPEFTGEMRGNGLGVRNFLQGVNVTDGELTITLRGTDARIERFSVRAGAGSAQLEGSATLGESPKAQLRLTADKFQLLGRVDRRIVTSGQAELLLDRHSLSLNGKFGINEGLFDFSRADTPSLSADVEVLHRTSSEAASDTTPMTSASTTRSAKLDLRVALGERLRIRGRGIDTGLRGELRITSPEGRLAVNGEVQAVDGTYAAYGQKLSIDRGVFSFNGPAENPRLDIEATRPNTDVRVGVIVTGSAQNPRIRLFSEPELSDTDKLSWLVLGRASDGLGRTDTALLQRAALALLAGEGESRTDQLVKTLGLDELSLRQTEGEVRETIVSLGRQLSRHWYVGYERSLNATSGTWQLIYRVARQFTLRAQSGLDNSLDVIWSWRWQ